MKTFSALVVAIIGFVSIAYGQPTNVPKIVTEVRGNSAPLIGGVCNVILCSGEIVTTEFLEVRKYSLVFSSSYQLPKCRNIRMVAKASGALLFGPLDVEKNDSSEVIVLQGPYDFGKDTRTSFHLVADLPTDIVPGTPLKIRFLPLDAKDVRLVSSGDEIDSSDIGGFYGTVYDTVKWGSMEDWSPFKVAGMPQCSLRQNYPNPFNLETKISFFIPLQARAVIAVYDAFGREIGKPLNAELPAGNHYVDFNGTGLASGTYFCKIVSGNFSQTIKMTLSK